MNWQQKADALNSLAEIDIKMRKVNDWYISQQTEIGGDGILCGEYGNGITPEEAVENHWFLLVDNIPPGKYIVTSARGDDRKNWLWNGYMWRELPQDSDGGGQNT